ncbi:cupin domain-containing protein [Larkinella rosea]|uniref:Cupin domain-containing protein n=1 Tax=Larkinella rosea TaxID=2025312 RepID=A0A3P1C0U7_9BACT|nr:cupin domain-containing protein [Larkinella rosea]RRB06829.1 cupin domain-containing protein [Larkinella rosea]
MNTFATAQATLNLSHVAIREADLDLAATCGIKYWYLPTPAHSKVDNGVVWLAAGANGTALHTHSDEEEYFSVEYGELEIFAGDRWIRLTAGQSLTIPAGTCHTLRNRSAHSCLYFYSIAPQYATLI